MRYRKPFDLAQRQKAIAAFRSMRRNYKLLRRVYAPADRIERSLLRDYRDLIVAFRQTLDRPDRLVDADTLNDLDTAATKAFVQYLDRKIRLGGAW